ncbi:MAG: L-threonylcarbamoyladenylate synthase [Acidimicrobiia bacterium]|nr:L-threonylcarbamoyladenylate synthase [Acidimicrobiia bacterium]MDH3399075.1 L-threonylcarbamoyladenylate synthase [Acidimicrobiia bacterium]
MRLDEAVAAIGRGEIVGVPTDTVYGLAVDPLQTGAVRALFDLKGRPRSKPIGLLSDTLDHFRSLVEVTPIVEELVAGHWPGPLTLVARSLVPLPDWVGDHGRHTVAIRVPDHPLTRELLSLTGPLAVTSANLSDQRPATSQEEAIAFFGGAVAVFLPGICSGGTSSTVVDVTVVPPKVLRQGPVRWPAL